MRVICSVVVVAGCGFSTRIGDNAGPDGTVASCTPQFRGASTAVSGSGSGVSVPTPALAQAGDVMIATILYQSDSDEPVGSISAPVEWTKVRADAFSGDDQIGQSVYWKVVTPNEAQSHRFSTGPSKRFIASLLAYSNASSTTPVQANSGRANTSSTSLTAEPLTSGPCSRVVGSFGIRAVTTIEPPNPMSERVELTNTMSATLALEGADVALDGVTGPYAATAADAADNIAQLTVLRGE